MKVVLLPYGLLSCRQPIATALWNCCFGDFPSTLFSWILWFLSSCAWSLCRSQWSHVQWKGLLEVISPTCSSRLLRAFSIQGLEQVPTSFRALPQCLTISTASLLFLLILIGISCVSFLVCCLLSCSSLVCCLVVGHTYENSLDLSSVIPPVRQTATRQTVSLLF